MPMCNRAICPNSTVNCFAGFPDYLERGGSVYEGRFVEVNPVDQQIQNLSVEKNA